MASTYLSRTPSSAGNRRTFTISVWFKRTKLDTFSYLFDCDGGSTQSENVLGLYQDRLGFSVWNTSSSSSAIDIRMNRKLRDTNAWYHIVCAVDTTQSTASDRVKLYLNGELQTDLSSNTYPSQNYETAINSTVPHAIGRWEDGAGRYFNGLMSHFHFCDGAALAPTVFGETDSTTGEWKINTNPTFTPGTNGFTVLKDGMTITDQSANSNNWSLGGGTLTKTEDCPSNVFATWNSLYGFTTYTSTYANGNTTVITGSTQYEGNPATLGASSGKYYWEVKASATSSTSSPPDNYWYAIGAMAEQTTNSGHELGHNANAIGYYGADGTVRINDSNVATLSTYITGDIIGIALDLDNNLIYFYKNGAVQNSGTGISIPSAASTPFGFWLPAVGDWDNNDTYTFDANFGNGYFGTTAVSSAGTNASGNGIFEYDVPTGYTALSTKGLNL